MVGDVIDGIGEPLDKKMDAYPPKATKYEDLSTESEVLYTGIKVIDLIELIQRGGKIGLLRAGVGKTV